MPYYAGVDVSQEKTAICIVDDEGRIVSERKVATCPDAITAPIGALMKARADVAAQVASIDAKVRSMAKAMPIVRL